jgi:hypothetical protein
LLIGVLLVAAITPFVVLRYRIGRSVAFCDAVEALPREQLEEYASRCDRLMMEKGGPKAELQLIRDTNILAQFALVGRRPYEIVVQEGAVAIKHIGGNWRYSTIAIWDEDFSANGEPIKVLKITSGTFGWRILCRRPVEASK